MNIPEDSECQCIDCRSACMNKPGWFAPGEAEKAAAHQNLSLKEFFDKYLVVDWWEDSPNVFVLAPTTTTVDPGGMMSARPNGQCVFFKDGKCDIHEVKPMECRKYEHARNEVHAYVADLWRKKKHHNQIKSLLGKEPWAQSYF